MIGHYKLNLKDLIDHLWKTKSQVVVGFAENLPKYEITNAHWYTLVDVNKNTVKLDNSWGTTFSVPKKLFIDNVYLIQASYFKNKIFKILENGTCLELTDSQLQ